MTAQSRKVRVWSGDRVANNDPQVEVLVVSGDQR